MMRIPSLLPLLLAIGSVAAQSTSPGISQDLLELVQARLATVDTHSWVMGTEAQALLELQYPDYSVFSEKAIPDLAQTSASDLPALFNLTQTVMAQLPANSLQLVSDGSASDPASLGTAVMLVAQMEGSETDAYMRAAENQLEALMQAPRTSEGAISHRVAYVQLWSDAVYMTPPFLAYYGLATGNQTLLQMAYDQCRLYRNALLTDEYLFAHVVLGPWQDTGLWATGNAWSAAGMMRTYATIAKSSFASSMSAQLGDLGNWSAQLVQNAWRFRNLATGGLQNYLGDESKSTFVDTASTALMAATTYRLAQYGIDDSMIPYAEQGRLAVQSSIDSYGWLHNVVDPITWVDLAEQSPEGQAFTLLMQASWRDWQQKTGTKIQSSSKRKRMDRWQ